MCVAAGVGWSSAIWWGRCLPAMLPSFSQYELCLRSLSPLDVGTITTVFTSSLQVTSIDASRSFGHVMKSALENPQSSHSPSMHFGFFSVLASAA